MVSKGVFLLMVNQSVKVLSLLLHRLVNEFNKWVVFLRGVMWPDALVLLLYFYPRFKLKTFLFFFFADFLENSSKFFFVDLSELPCFFMDWFGPGLDII